MAEGRSSLIAERAGMRYAAATVTLGCYSCYSAMFGRCTPIRDTEGGSHCPNPNGDAADFAELSAFAARNPELVTALKQELPFDPRRFRQAVSNIVINMAEEVDTSMNIDPTLPPPKKDEWPWNFQPMSAQELEAIKGAVVSGLVDPNRPDIGANWPWDRMAESIAQTKRNNH